MDTSSWLGKAVSRYSRSLSPDDARPHSKPPRWRTPSPMSASMVPPPIVASSYLKPSPSLAHPPSMASQPANSEPSIFRRKQKQLEADLQILLNAQADGLLSGLDAKATDDDATSTGSSTPTAMSSNLRSTHNGTSNLQRHTKIGLREARKGLYTTMRKLCLLKAQELEYLGPDVEECNAIVSQLDEWERRKERLEERTRQIYQGDEHKRANDLRQRADDMQNDINDLEARLARLKTQQRKLRREALDCENEVKAKLSSYTASLDLLEQNSKHFLTGLQRERVDSALPRDDRHGSDNSTLKSVRQSYSVQQKQLRSQQGDIDKEREALEEGAVVWKDVVKEVSEFERKLREDMARMSPGNSKSKLRLRVGGQGNAGEEEKAQQHNEGQGMQDLLALLDQTTTQLESKYKLAQTRSWKLLVAAIGAELEACLKGKTILEAALAASIDDAEDPTVSITNELGTGDTGDQSIYDDFRTPRSSQIRHVDDEDAIHDLDQAFEAKKENHSAGVSDTDTEDDGPDPELLISHQDTDDE